MSEYKDYGYHSENLNHIHAYVLKPLLNFLSTKENRKILDLGCGNGWLANLLIVKGYDVYGVDASVSGITIAKKKNPYRFYIQDLSTDDLPSELSEKAFNTIISTEV